MSVNPELLEILVCPETKQPVKLADTELLEMLDSMEANSGPMPLP